ncbi:MAG: hypothetical protein JW806_00950 [Sedimentisphaerales bacterium]|nr:hypothetical protein [Sedimentisphaerales bacterium]
MHQDDLSKLNKPIFSSKKSLLTVDQYAARQGVSKGIVQEAARLGVVQVRKHKDKTFIVDLPLNVNEIAREPDNAVIEDFDADFCTDKITELVNRICKSDNSALPLTNESTNVDLININDETIDLDDETIFDVDAQIDQDQEIVPVTPEQIQETEPIFEPEPLAEPQPSESVSYAEDEFLQNWNDWPVEPLDLTLLAESENEISDNSDIDDHELGRFRVPVLRNIIESISAVSPSRALFTFMIITFAVSISAFIWVSNDRKMQQQKLRTAYENITNLMTKYENTKQQARLFELDMDNWRSEAQDAEKTMADYKTEIENLKQSLYEARSDLERTQRYNTDVLRKLNQQISKIRTQTPQDK